MKTDRATLSSEQLATIIREAEASFPQECCGLLFGQRAEEDWQITRTYAMRNAGAKPELGFEFDAREQLRAYHEAEAAGLEIVGHYHSHPNARAGPSPTDLQNARERYDRGLWLILAIAHGKFFDASLWQLRGEPGEFVRVRLESFWGQATV